MAKQRLTMKGLDELSLVDNPANQHAAVAIAKRMRGAPKFADRLSALAKRFLNKVAPAEQVELEAIIKEAETYEDVLNRPEIWEKNSALGQVVSSIIDDDALSKDEKRAKIDAALSAYRDDILSVTKAAAATCEKCGAVMKDGACPDGHTTKAVPPAPADPVTIEPTGAENMRTAKTFTDLAQANAHIGELTTELVKVEGERDDAVTKADPIAAITKGMSPAAAVEYRKSMDRIAKLEADRLDTGRVAKALRIFKGVISDDDAGTNAALAVMKVLDGVASDAERATALEFVTKLATQHAEVVKELDGLEVGGAGANATSGEDRDEALTKAAREIMKVEKGLTLPQAIAKALEQNPDLYDDSDAPEPAEA